MLYTAQGGKEAPRPPLGNKKKTKVENVEVINDMDRQGRKTDWYQN